MQANRYLATCLAAHLVQHAGSASAGILKVVNSCAGGHKWPPAARGHFQSRTIVKKFSKAAIRMEKRNHLQPYRMPLRQLLRHWI